MSHQIAAKWTGPDGQQREVVTRKLRSDTDAAFIARHLTDLAPELIEAPTAAQAAGVARSYDTLAAAVAATDWAALDGRFVLVGGAQGGLFTVDAAASGTADGGIVIDVNGGAQQLVRQSFNTTSGGYVPTKALRPSLAVGRFREFVAATAHSRVDFVGIGDSNQLHAQNGWDYGFVAALLARGANMYATGLVSAMEGGDGSTEGIGYESNMFPISPSGDAATSGAPSGVNDALKSYFPHFYAYIEAGETLPKSESRGLILNAACPIDVDSAIRYEFSYGTFSSGSGQFDAGVRRADIPYTGISTSGVISTNTGSDGVAVASITLSAASRGYPLIGGFAMSNSSVDATGPFAGMWIRAINTDRAAGFSYHTMIAQGGESLRTMATILQSEWPSASLAHYFSRIRANQGLRKRVCVLVNSGINDRAEDQPSVGPHPVVDGDSPEAYADNLRAIVNVLRSVWIDNGWPLGELLIAVSPSHPVSEPNDAELESYLIAAQDVASEYDCVVVIPIQELTNYAIMNAESLYVSGADRYHLSTSGYKEVASMVLGY